MWKAVVGFPRYEVSSLGRFRRKATGGILNGTAAHNGYLHITLTRDGRVFTQIRHRLVALSFLGEPPTPLHVHVNHRNKIRNDNRVSNLEWSTRSENAKHAKSYQHTP